MGEDLQYAEKLAMQLLAEGCYGAEHAFIRPVRNPPFMHFSCACACTGVEQVINSGIIRSLHVQSRLSVNWSMRCGTTVH